MRHITINPDRILQVLVVLTALFAGINTVLLFVFPWFNAGMLDEPIARFNMNAEISIPTWYSQLVLFLASVLLFVNGRANKTLRTYGMR